jgi:hypothetical protein
MELLNNPTENFDSNLQLTEDNAPLSSVVEASDNEPNNVAAMMESFSLNETDGNGSLDFQTESQAAIDDSETNLIINYLPHDVDDIDLHVRNCVLFRAKNTYSRFLQ